MDPCCRMTRILPLPPQPVDKLHLVFHYTRPPDYDFRAAGRTYNGSFQWVTLQPSRKACAMDLIRGSFPMVTSEKLATGSTMSESRSTAGNNIKKGGPLQDHNKVNLTSDWTDLLRQMFMDIFSHHICGPALANHLLVLVSQENLVQAIHTTPELHFLASHTRPPDHS